MFALETRDRFLTIDDRRSRELVTTIELLSPRNKASGTRGQREFLAKRETVFATRTHGIEIDRPRAGERPEEVAGKSDYYVVLDLQAALATVYARARYADDLDYTRPVPPPPLRPADAAWAAQCVARWPAGRTENLF